MQALTHQLGGKVSSGLKREYGHAVLHQNVVDHPIFKGLPLEMPVWMSHGDEISEPPPGFSSLAYTDNAPVAVLGNDRGIIGLQFHPEVSHTPNGADILKNFLYEVCGCKGTWTPASFITEATDRIRDQVGGGKVICALVRGSGLGGDGGAGAEGYREPVDVHLRRQRAVEEGGVGEGEGGVRTAPEPEPDIRGRCGQIPGEAGRGYRPGEEAAHHRGGVHPCVRGGGGRVGRSELPGAGTRCTPMSSRAFPRRTHPR